jgi:hypothetical protein
MKAVIGKQDIPGLVIIAIIGLGLSSLGFTKIKRAEESKRWPVTSGVITSSQISGAIKYYPSITYTYSVDSVFYNSNGISNINFNTKNRTVVEEFLDKYPVGSEVKVYYNDLKPDNSFLEPGINTGHILLLAFGIMLLAIPIFLTIFMKVERSRKIMPK